MKTLSETYYVTKTCFGQEWIVFKNSSEFDLFRHHEMMSIHPKIRLIRSEIYCIFFVDT